MTLNMTLISGPTVLIEAGGFRLVTGPFHLTMDINDAIETAHAFPAP
jgi:hypothetical protein